MTQNATNFIHPITFESLTANKCLVDTFDRNFPFQVEHISIAKRAELVMLAPTSAKKDLQGKKILITAGPTSLKPWPFVKAVQTTSAREMFEAVTAVSDSQDIIIKAAAVADYRPARVSSHKMKKKEDAAGIIPDKLLSL